ncbi:hypothetical protein ACH3XW_18340 [Acanthocheilonema viteae]
MAGMQIKSVVYLVECCMLVCEIDLKKWIISQSDAYLPEMSIGRMIKDRELGQEKNLSFFARQSEGYRLVDKFHVTGLKGFVTDFTRNSKGDQLAYTTSNECGTRTQWTTHIC